MKRTVGQKTEADYATLVEKELAFYGLLADELDLGVEVFEQAAKLGVRMGIRQHRNSACSRRESGCVAGSVRHFCDRIVIKACLMAVNEDEMERAEDIIMRLIEEN